MVYKKIQKSLKAIAEGMNAACHHFAERFHPMKVSFIVVGAQKGGTSALHYFLKQNPGIALPRVKETDFFSYHYHTDYRFYHRKFHPFMGERMMGEVSPSYMLEHEVVSVRIKAYNSEMKLIFILKNPVERAYSQYKMHLNKYGIKYSFEECLEIAKNNNGKDIIFDPKSGLSTKTLESYFEFGHYSRQIQSFQSHFPAHQMLFLRTEELLENHDVTLNRVFDFLGVPQVQVPAKIIHSYQGAPMSEAAKLILYEEFQTEIESLEKMLGWDLQRWKRPG